MNVLITGSSGLIGRHLSAYLGKQGHKVSRLLRKIPASGSGDQFWDPSRGALDPTALERHSAIVHLGGAPIAGGRFTAARRALLWKSRVESTRLLVQGLRALSSDQRPQVLVSASAVGYYAYGMHPLDEEGPQGSGFLADLCAAWEKEAQAAQELGLRVVCLRIGVVLSRAGGALSTLLRVQRLGLGAVLGSGTQYVSWIHVQDLLQMIEAAVSSDDWKGIYNATSPYPVRHRDFIYTLAKAAGHRIWLPPVPAFFLQMLLGSASDLLLKSQHILPTRALQLGFRFRFDKLSASLNDLIIL